MKFEPKTPNEFIGNDDPNLPLFYLDEWDSDSPQCLLFSGQPGLGKTTAAYIIGRHFNLDIVELNASDDRGIDAVRNKIKGIAMSSSLWNARLILLDEFEGMTKPAQEALKRMMEKSNCWWILTCNDASAVIPAIKSRCVHFKFKPYTTKQVRAYARNLHGSTGKITSDDLDDLTAYYGGDLRAIGNHILSGHHLSEDQSTFDEMIMDLAAGEWAAVANQMKYILSTGSSVHSLMFRMHKNVKTVGLSTERLYTFFVVWGNFVLRMHQWPLGDESFIDYFVASLHDKENKNNGGI